MKKYVLARIIVIVILIIGGAVLHNMFNKPKGFIPENGVIPDEETAIKIAEAIWLPIYGDTIYLKEPFIAEFYEKEKCWYVHGSLPQNSFGGVPEIRISKSDGRVLYINHGK